MDGMAGKTALPPVPDGLHPAHPLYMAVLWHGVWLLPILRGMTPEQLTKTLETAGGYSLENPLHLERAFKFNFEHVRSGHGGLTGAQVIAVMVFGLFVRMEENPENCVALCDRWPIMEAVRMVEMGF